MLIQHDAEDNVTYYNLDDCEKEQLVDSIEISNENCDMVQSDWQTFVDDLRAANTGDVAVRIEHG